MKLYVAFGWHWINRKLLSCECPQCYGRGILCDLLFVRVAPEDLDDNLDLRAESNTSSGSIPCPVCQGAGWVTNARLKRWQQGQTFEEYRVKRGLGLREAADKMGIKPSILSCMEMGGLPLPNDIYDRLDSASEIQLF